MHLVAVSVFAPFIALSLTSTVVASVCHDLMHPPDKVVRSMRVACHMHVCLSQGMQAVDEPSTCSHCMTCKNCALPCPQETSLTSVICH